MSPVTDILSAIEQGDPVATEKLLPLVYNELRKLATVKLAQEKPGQTLEATALVHEAYLRLLGPLGRNPSWDNRGHFFAAAAEAMRRILVENARCRKSIKAGGMHHRIELSKLEPEGREPSLDLLALDDAIKKLEEKDPRKAKLIKLRFFTGLSNQQAAAVLGIAPSTADLDWAYAKCWLRIEMSECSDQDT